MNNSNEQDISPEAVNRMALAVKNMTFPYNTHGMPQKLSDMLEALRTRLTELEQLRDKL